MLRFFLTISPPVHRTLIQSLDKTRVNQARLYFNHRYNYFFSVFRLYALVAHKTTKSPLTHTIIIMAGVDMDFLNKMFDTLDSDKNGSISEAELIDVFKKFDTDGKSRSIAAAGGTVGVTWCLLL